MSKSTAFLGIGLMGKCMSINLSKSSEVAQVYTWNRTYDKAEEAAKGYEKIKPTKELKDAISSAQYIFIMLNDFPTIKKLIIEDEAIKQSLKGKTVIQHSTVASKENIELAEAVESVGGRFLESPVLGATKIAEKGELQIFTSGDSKIVAEVEPLLSHVGKITFRSSERGKASVLKLAMNQLIISQVVSFGYSMALVRQNGIDTSQFMDITRNSAMYSKYMDLKFEMNNTRNYTPVTFPEKLSASKDLGCMAEEGKNVGLDTSVIEAMLKLGVSGMELGWGEDDMASLQEAILKQKKGDTK